MQPIRACPYCGGEPYVLDMPSLAQRFKCRECRQHYSGTTGTYRQSSKLAPAKWDALEKAYRDGVNAHKASLALGITYKTTFRIYRILAAHAQHCHA